MLFTQSSWLMCLSGTRWNPGVVAAGVAGRRNTVPTVCTYYGTSCHPVGFECNFCSDSSPDCPLIGVIARNARSIQKEANYCTVAPERTNESKRHSPAKVKATEKRSRLDIETRPNADCNSVQSTRVCI